MNRRERWMLAALGAVQFTNILDFMIMAPLGPQLMRTLHINTAQFGAILSAYTISAGISGFASAFYADRFDRKELLFKVYIGFLVGTLLCAFAESYHLLLLARLFTGAFGGILGATCMSIVSDTIPAERRGQAMGIVMAAFSLASVIGIPFGLQLVQMLPQLTWHSPFLAVVVLGIPVLALIGYKVPQVREHIMAKSERPGPVEVLSSFAKDANQVWAIALMGVIMLGRFFMVPFIAPSMVFNVHLPEANLAQIYFFGGLASFFTGPLIGRISDKVGKPVSLVVVTLLTIIPVYTISVMGEANIWWALTATTAFFIFSGGCSIVGTALVSNAVPPARRGTFMSINTSVQNLTAGLATWIGGLIVTTAADKSLQNLSTVGLLAVGCFLGSVFLIPKIKQLKAVPQELAAVEA